MGNNQPGQPIDAHIEALDKNLIHVMLLIEGMISTRNLSDLENITDSDKNNLDLMIVPVLSDVLNHLSIMSDITLEMYELNKPKS